MPDSRSFWDRAARRDIFWHIATGGPRDEAGFYRQGAEETDTYLAFTGLRAAPDRKLLEIGCGAGRMTRRLAERFGEVLALDVSVEMLGRCRSALGHADNVTYLLGNGRDLSDVSDGGIDAVFSYVVLQHIPSADVQLAYLREVARVLAPGGQAAVQIRAIGLRPRALDLIGHVGHAVQGRRTWRPEWRGSRLKYDRAIAALGSRGGSVRLLSWGVRHVWLVLERDSATGVDRAESEPATAGKSTGDGSGQEQGIDAVS